MATRVTLNSAGVAALLRSRGVDQALEILARRVEARAKATAPVETGEYRDSIHVETRLRGRVVKRIGSGVDHARVVEAKTGNLARALDAAGD